MPTPGRAHPRAATFRRPVQVRFDPPTLARVTALATREGWTWQPSATAPPAPSTSDAVRRLVIEALDAREGGAVVPATSDPHVVVTVKQRSLDWIDEQATTAKVSRDEMVRTLLLEAKQAREKRAGVSRR